MSEEKESKSGESKSVSSECKCEQKDIDENKGLAAISYLWILFLIPLLTKKDSPYAQFHAKQGLALFVASLVIGAASAIPVIGWFLISWIGSLIILVLFIMGLLNALSGKCEELPVIGKWFMGIKV